MKNGWADLAHHRRRLLQESLANLSIGTVGVLGTNTWSGHVIQPA